MNNGKPGPKSGTTDRVALFISRQQLLARMEAALERAQPRPARSIQVGPLSVCTVQRVATWRGQNLPLSPREFDILVMLAERQGSIVSRDDLFNHLWDFGFVGQARLIDRHVMKLRQKLGDGAGLIETIWGTGYRLTSGRELPEEAP